MRSFRDSLSQPWTICPRPIENVSFRGRFTLDGVMETPFEMIWETGLDEPALIALKKWEKNLLHP
jgi:hypothetical protein